MKKRLFIALVVVLALAAAASVVWAKGGGPNGTFVHFQNGGDCYSYWLKTGSGLVHEWRYGDPSCAAYEEEDSLHLVFKPLSKFESADCDDDGYLGGFKWTFDYSAYTDIVDGDEGDLTDFLTPGDEYWVCFYKWGE